MDLKYPKELHDLHNNFPLAPERLITNRVEKLIKNLNDEEKYILSHRTLKQYLNLGSRIKKIHRRISFKKEPWLKKHIKLNTKLYTNTKNESEKEFLKLMNTAVFGKTMENIRNHVDVKLINNLKEALKAFNKPVEIKK